MVGQTFQSDQGPTYVKSGKSTQRPSKTTEIQDIRNRKIICISLNVWVCLAPHKLKSTQAIEADNQLTRKSLANGFYQKFFQFIRNIIIGPILPMLDQIGFDRIV